jgi:hypothetical protein
MKKFFSALLLFSSAVIGSSDELTQHRLRSVSVALEDVTSAHADANILDDVLPRELKKEKKRPKVPKKPKSAKGLAKDPCAAITTQKDALLALKEGFTNGDTELADWVSTTDPCDGPWEGITCDSDGKVTSINLCK